jgi:hypothetical protein
MKGATPARIDVHQYLDGGAEWALTCPGVFDLAQGRGAARFGELPLRQRGRKV